MAKIIIPGEKFNKVLEDVEILIEDVTSLLNQDEIVKKRVKEVETSFSIGKSEKELDNYLKKRGVKIE